MEKKKPFKPNTDSAQEKDFLNNPQLKDAYRNALFDRIVATGMEFYVALLIDNPPEDPLNTLFCGNVGEINNVFMDEEHGDDKNSFEVLFLDYENKEDEFFRCGVNKKYLLPLFCFSPLTYDKIITQPQEKDNYLQKEELNINSIRDQWENLNCDIISNNTLRKHKRVETRFQLGKLVTIQFDFKQKIQNNGFFIIQAGQVGVISKTQDLGIDCVEVTFVSMSLEELVFTRNKNTGTGISSSNSWERKICIHKDFLFPLYVEQLE